MYPAPSGLAPQYKGCAMIVDIFPESDRPLRAGSLRLFSNLCLPGCNTVGLFTRPRRGENYRKDRHPARDIRGVLGFSGGLGRLTERSGGPVWLLRGGCTVRHGACVCRMCSAICLYLTCSHGVKKKCGGTFFFCFSFFPVF